MLIFVTSIFMSWLNRRLYVKEIANKISQYDSKYGANKRNENSLINRVAPLNQEEQKLNENKPSDARPLPLRSHHGSYFRRSSVSSRI